MTQFTEYFQWDFPGGVPGLISAIIVCIIVVALSYKYTLRQLPFVPKMFLGLSRTAFVLIVLGCLCQPKMVQEEKSKPKGKKKVAVLIDNSSSMLKKGFWGKSRYDEAVNYWNNAIFENSDMFEFHKYLFAEKLNPVNDFSSHTAEVKGTKSKTVPTRLYDSVSSWTESFSADKFDGVICFTDGVDTSGRSIDNAIDALDSSEMSHAFIPMTESLPSVPFVSFDKVEVDTTAKVGTNVPVTAVVSFSGIDSSSPLLLSVKNDKGEEVYELDIEHGTNSSATQAANFTIPMCETGLHKYAATITVNDEVMSKATWSIQAVEDAKAKILLYQGGLDWGTRYISRTFANDDLLDLDIKFAPNSFGNRNLYDPEDMKFPSSEELAKYEAVVILKMKREQISSEIEVGLRRFVENGGAVLFIIANTLDAQEYVSSPLERLLPVEFETIGGGTKIDAKTSAFLKKMSQYRTRKSPKYVRGRERTLDVPPLHKFKLTNEGESNLIFKYLSHETKVKPEVPQFQDFALIRRGKPGSSVLAIHPSMHNNAESRILMAVQPFGKGRAAVLATDPLWRWKLRMGSDNHSYEAFWKSFIGWLGAGQKYEPYWELTSRVVKPGQEIDVKLKVPARTDVVATTLKNYLIDMTTGKETKLKMSQAKDKEVFKTAIVTEPNKQYNLVTLNADDDIIAETYFSSTIDNANLELKTLKPGLDTFNLLSRRYSNIVVDKGSSFDWRKWLPGSDRDDIVTRKEQPLWHHQWLFLLLIGLFLGELIVRRMYKLV